MSIAEPEKFVRELRKPLVLSEAVEFGRQMSAWVVLPALAGVAIAPFAQRLRINRVDFCSVMFLAILVASGAITLLRGFRSLSNWLLRRLERQDHISSVFRQAASHYLLAPMATLGIGLGIGLLLCFVLADAVPLLLPVGLLVAVGVSMQRLIGALLRSRQIDSSILAVVSVLFLPIVLVAAGVFVAMPIVIVFGVMLVAALMSVIA